MGEETDTSPGEVVYLLAELRSDARGPVHEIGSRARVLESDGDRLTLAVVHGSEEDVVTCTKALVRRSRRSPAPRRSGYRGVSPA
jgi:hypothetical protein